MTSTENSDKKESFDMTDAVTLLFLGGGCLFVVLVVAAIVIALVLS